MLLCTVGTDRQPLPLPIMENIRPQDENIRPQDEDPRETPLDDPRQQTDAPHHKQTNEPWKGNPEKDQLPPDRPDIDLENGRRATPISRE